MAIKFKNKCPKGKYWVSSYKRKVVGKNGKTHIEIVKGYCSSYRTPYHKIAAEENISLDLHYFALTIYGESRSENDASRRAIAWIIQNRFDRSKSKSYQKVVLRRTQFDCWSKSDSNYERLQHPGQKDAIDKIAWQEIIKIAKEIQHAPKNQNLLPKVYNYFSGNPKKQWETHYFDLPGIPNFHFVRFK